jgi:hypothetical protein
MSSIAETARLEAATETLAEYIGYLNGEIDAELEAVNPNRERVAALSMSWASCLASAAR